MLTIKLDEVEYIDDVDETFGVLEATTIRLEHSLYSISKWELVYEKPFVSDERKTSEEIADYICMMSVDDEIDIDTVRRISYADMEIIKDYMTTKKATATFFNESKKKSPNIVVTSELIYYYMVALQIPFEAQYWHFHRLMTLIKICQIKGETQKKMSKSEILAENRKLNEMRRKEAESRG